VEKDNTDIRYRIIELLGYWAGLVNTTQLMQQLIRHMITSSPKKSFPIDYDG
jgi:hypothetical protein